MIVPTITGLFTGGATAIAWLAHSKHRWPDLFGCDDFGKAAMLGMLGFIPGFVIATTIAMFRG